jgi:putative ABC transport system substrate-binding protein
MNRRTFVCIAGAALLGPANRRAQAQEKMRRIGFLSGFPRAGVDAFLTQLRPELDKLGWTDGRNIVLLEPRTTDGRGNERLQSMASELVAQNPDIIIVQTTPATRALMQATKSIPIVMASAGNPVENGLIADYRKPGGNVTGSAFLADESIRKLLQLLKEADPRVRSVAVFVNPSNEAAATLVKQLRAEAADMAMQPHVLEVSRVQDFEVAFGAIRSARTQAILIVPEPLIQANRGAIADFAQAQRLPLAVVGSSRVLPPNGLMAYGPSSAQYPQLTARYVDRILKGAKPGDLPVEQPTLFELTINLKAAKALGLNISQALLQRADEVIQ